MYKDVHSIILIGKSKIIKYLLQYEREIQYEIVQGWTNTKIIKLCLMKKHK